MIVGVIGGSAPSQEHLEMGESVGRFIAENGHILVCGGRGGVMEAASRGACNAGGLTVGILPGTDRSEANQHITLPITTGMGLARNVIIIQTADVLLAIDGSYGTLSEIALALNAGKHVIALGTWELEKIRDMGPRFHVAKGIEEVKELVNSVLS